MKTAFIIILLPVLSCLANQAVQTDWITGPGTNGPVTDWEDVFESSEDISWFSVPGQIALSSIPLAVPVINEVDTFFEGVYTADVGDMNGDGMHDIVAGGYQANELRVWIADGQGGWDSNMVSNSVFGPCGVDVADIDSDGDLDILCTTYTGNRVLLYLNNGAASPTWDEVVIETLFEGGHDVEACDMDLDGDPDILAASAEGDRVAWWRNDGGTPLQWFEQDVSLNPNYPCRIQACDLDGDGNIDVTASAWQGNRVYVWYGSGGSTPSWTEQIVNTSSVYGAHSVRASDVDLDGDPDLIVSAMNGGTLLLFRNEGQSPVQWTRESIESFGSCAYARPGDIDGDGDPDIVASSFSSGGAAWWENESGGTSWTKHLFASGMGSVSCALPADVDNDGDLDAVITCYGIGELHWVELSEFTDSGWLQSSILDTGENPQWASIEWDSYLPANTDIIIRFKSSDDYGNMGSWSAGYSTPSEISGALYRYFQYRIELASTASDVSALVTSFRLNWDATGISGQVNPSATSLTLQGGNPVRGPLTLDLQGALNGDERIMIFDSSGRMVWSSGILDPASISITVPASALCSGSYRACLQNMEGNLISLPLVLLGS
ncbi:MAG: VCBS repeat-containing protein [Candidatus Aegiribacteria sp.]|nr:VCBS repeat-containing protein [Candidatus Aegiribacteria sp.]